MTPRQAFTAVIQSWTASLVSTTVLFTVIMFGVALSDPANNIQFAYMLMLVLAGCAFVGSLPYLLLQAASIGIYQCSAKQEPIKRGHLQVGHWAISFLTGIIMALVVQEEIWTYLTLPIILIYAIAGSIWINRFSNDGTEQQDGEDLIAVDDILHL